MKTLKSVKPCASRTLQSWGLSPTTLWWYLLNSLLVSPSQRSYRSANPLSARYCWALTSHHCGYPSWEIRKSSARSLPKNVNHLSNDHPHCLHASDGIVGSNFWRRIVVHQQHLGSLFLGHKWSSSSPFLSSTAFHDNLTSWWWKLPSFLFFEMQQFCCYTSLKM